MTDTNYRNNAKLETKMNNKNLNLGTLGRRGGGHCQGSDSGPLESEWNVPIEQIART